MSHEIIPSIFNLTLFCILYSSTSQCPHLQFFCASFYTLLLPNCFRIKSVLTSSSSHVVVNLLAPNYNPSTFDTIHNMLNGYNIFPSFPWHNFQQWHWSPHNTDINNPQFMVLDSRKMQSCIGLLQPNPYEFYLNPAHTHINVSYFYYVSLILTQIMISVMFHSFTIAFCKTR